MIEHPQNRGQAGVSRARHPWRGTVLRCILALVLGCGGRDGVSADRNDLSTMDTARIGIGDHSFEVWLARSQTERQRGLMQVTQDELAPIADESGRGLADTYRGMLFVFPTEQPLSFWMLNTIIPLDIAYIRKDGAIVSTYTMAPLETRSYPSVEPARFALEVSAGLFAQLGIAPGDHVEIPESVLKGMP